MFFPLYACLHKTKRFSSKRMNWWNTNVIPLEALWKKVKHDLSACNFHCHVNFRAITQLPTLSVSGYNSCGINLCSSSSSSCEARVPSAATELRSRAVCPVSLIVTQVKLPSQGASSILLDGLKHTDKRWEGEMTHDKCPKSQDVALVHLTSRDWCWD